MKSEEKIKQNIENYNPEQQENDDKKINQVKYYKSPHLQKYQQFFQNMAKQQKIESYICSLADHKITYNTEIFCSSPSVSFLSSTKNGSAMHLSISFSYFNFQISVMNFMNSSPTKSQLELHDFGGMSNIYAYNTKQNEYIIKSINYNLGFDQPSLLNKHYKINDRHLLQAILECCYSKLFSALEIGPSFEKIFGFDLIIYNESIEFAMQKCLKVPIESDFENLKTLLKFIHSFQIIHGDIKPQNIMFSPKLKKLVFIDFGLTKTIPQTKGMLSQTKYFGTYNYVTEQMKKIFIRKREGLIDLYYNDIHALNKTLQSDKDFYVQNQLAIQKEKQKSKLKKRFVSFSFQDYIINTKLCSYILQKDYYELSLYLNSKEIKNIEEFTIQLFLQLPINRNVICIFDLIAKKFNLTNIIIDKIHKYFENRSNIYINKQIQTIFHSRIKQCVPSQKIPLSSMMIFTKLFYSQNISPTAIIQKSKYLKILTNYYKNKQNVSFDKQFWLNFILYINNIYTKQFQVNEVLQMAKKILKIERWEFEIENNLQQLPTKIRNNNFNTKYFQIYLKSKQITQKVKQQYGINLFKIRYNIQIQNCQHIRVSYSKKIRKAFSRNILLQQNKLINIELINKYKKVIAILEQSKQVNKLNIKHYNRICELINLSIENNDDYGIILLLKIIQRQQEYQNVGVVFEKISKLQVQLSKYSIIRKSRPSLHVMKLVLAQIEKNKGHENILMIAQNIKTNFYNYCFQYDVLIPVIMYQIILIDIIRQPKLICFTQLKKCVQYFIKSSKIVNDTNANSQLKKKLFQIIDNLRNLFTQNQSIQKCIVYLIVEIYDLFQYEIAYLKFVDYRNMVQILKQFNQNSHLFFKHYQKLNLLEQRIRESYKKLLIKNNEKQAQNNAYKFLVLKLEFDYFFQHKSQQIFQSQFFKLEQKLSLINSMQTFYFYNFYLVYVYSININPEVFLQKLFERYKKQGIFQKHIMKQYRTITNLNMYYKKRLKQCTNQQPNKYLKKCQQILKIILNLYKVLNQYVSIYDHYMMGYYMVAINNSYIMLTSNYGFFKAFKFIFQNIKFKFKQIVSQKTNEIQEIKKFANVIPILEQLLNMLMHKTVYNVQDIQRLSKYVFMIMKYISFLIPYCYSFYRRRLFTRYFHIILALSKRGFLIFHQLCNNNKYGKQRKSIIKLTNNLQMKNYRSQQFPISEKSIIHICRNIKSKLKYYIYLNQSNNFQNSINSYQIGSIRHCLKIEQKVYMYNNNKKQKIQITEALVMNTRYLQVYKNMINETHINVGQQKNNK